MVTALMKNEDPKYIMKQNLIDQKCQQFFLSKNIHDVQFNNFLGFLRYIVFVGTESFLQRLIEVIKQEYISDIKSKSAASEQQDVDMSQAFKGYLPMMSLVNEVRAWECIENKTIFLL